ncbi:MAG TPA: PAS domain-containing protein, partial [Burkholderiales bacterium]|nr:PAS domain-containing protein [Burkholderiales bacterium]
MLRRLARLASRPLAAALARLGALPPAPLSGLEGAIIDALPISVAIRDTSGRFLRVNRTWERYFGIRREDALGRRFAELPGWSGNAELARVAVEAAQVDREVLARGPGAEPLLFEDTRLGRSYLLGRQAFADASGRVAGVLATGIDTTELRETQRALELERERLRDQMALTDAIVKQMPNAIFTKDAEGRFTLVNRGWSEMSGVAEAQAIGKTVHDIYPPELARRFAEEDAALIAQGAAAKPIESLHQGPRPGQYRIVRKVVLSREDGSVQGLISSSTDVSELKRVETELRDQMVLTRALIDENPSAMYLKDTQGRYVTVNDAWLRMVGVTRERAIGRTVRELFPEAASERYHAEDMRLLAQGSGSSEVESLRTGPDGEPQWVIVRKAVLRGDNGRVIGLIGANTDITRLKHYEEQLADRARFVEQLVDALPISVAMRDAEGRYRLVNRAWESYFGVRREDALGRRRRELPGWQEDASRRADADEIEAIDRRALERGPDHVEAASEIERLGRNYLISRRVLADAAGKPVGVLSAGIDMTERRAMEQALAAERQRLALVVRATQAGIVDWDTATETPWYSERFLEMLGYTDAASCPPLFGGLVHPEDRDRSREVFLNGLMSSGEPQSVSVQEPLEVRLRRADGEYLWVQSMGLTLRDAQGNAVRYLAAVTDIGVRRAQEEALRNQVKFIQDLFDSVPVSLAMRDAEGRFLYVNRTWETYLGQGRDAVIGRHVRECMTPEEAADILTGDRAALARGAGAPIELVEFPFRGRTLMQTRTVMSDAQGQVLGVLVASLDVSERRAIEERLATEQRRLDLVVRGARVGIVDWDGHTHATYYSPIFREILGYPPDADTSDWPDYFKVLIHPEDREAFTRRWQAFIRGKGPEGPRAEHLAPQEHRLLRRDGSYVWVQVSGIAVRDARGFTTRWIGATTDITERRKQQEALRESVRLREEVERMSRHDLKTPLNSVIALSSLLRESGKLAPEDAEVLGTIERAGYRILNMVNLSLDLFRMETGTYRFNPRAVDLAGVARRVAADLESQAASKNIDVRVRANDASAASHPVLASADELLCYSMFANLVKNAIEAAPHGSVVSVLLHEEGEAVLAKIHNAGMIPEPVRERFFQKYVTSGKSAGLGLGSYSARLMARVQGGELTLQSSDPSGTSLLVRLPAARGADLLADEAAAPAAR